MQLVFREGGQAGLDAINNIIKNAPPIETLSSYEMSPVDTYESNDNYRENYSYQYDPSTGQTSFIDGSEFDHPSASATNSSYTFNNSTRSLMPRAYPNYWFEYNPQNYFDTRSTCKLTIMLKDGSYGYGSGFMIGPNHIATAGHCIYIKEENSNTAEWCDYIVVTPANRSAYPS